MAGGNASEVIIMLREGSVDYVRVAARVGREYSGISVQRETDCVRLTSDGHSEAHLSAIWWSAAATEAQALSAAAFRGRVMEYLLG